MLSTIEWHNRYLQQARWTGSLRQYLYQKAGLQLASCVLEVGCGTGAVLKDFIEKDNLSIQGLDISSAHLELAKYTVPGAILSLGDGHFLPYQTAVFDIAICHFLLLWVKDPVAVVKEMVRVVKQQGAVLILAEPDYGGRVDFPFELVRMGELQSEALKRQGAAPYIGRQIAKILKDSGLTDIETGVLGGEWQTNRKVVEDWQREWDVFQADVDGLVSEADLQDIKHINDNAWKLGERTLYIPTFFGWGQKS